MDELILHLAECAITSLTPLNFSRQSTNYFQPKDITTT